MSNLPADNFFNNIDYTSIVDNLKGIFTSDGSINILLDFERVLDEADMYAFKNWELGELVSGPENKKYTVACIFMYPEQLMPDPRAGKRLLHLGCTIHFKKTTIEVPVKVEGPDDFSPGTRYPKLVEKTVWLVRIEIPKELMSEIRDGSIDLAGDSIDLDELEDSYKEDLDKESTENQDEDQEQTEQLNQPMGQMPAGGL